MLDALQALLTRHRGLVCQVTVWSSGPVIELAEQFPASIHDEDIAGSDNGTTGRCPEIVAVGVVQPEHDDAFIAQREVAQ